MPVVAPVCPYCHASAILCDASAVYGVAFNGQFNLWVCANYPICDSYVGVHRDQMEPKPLGTMANAELRGLRKRVHALLDPLWKPGPSQQFKGKKARTLAYLWLSDALGSKGNRQFHAAEANEDQCRRALSILYLKSGGNESKDE